MSARSGQERTESDDVTFKAGVTDDFTTVSVGCTSYFLSPVKGGQIYFKTSHRHRIVKTCQTMLHDWLTSVARGITNGCSKIRSESY